MIIQAGKTYQCANGFKVVIDFTDGNFGAGHFYDNQRMIVSTWNLDGHQVGYNNSCLDIIGEWQEPLEVSVICVMDRNGSIHMVRKNEIVPHDSRGTATVTIREGEFK